MLAWSVAEREGKFNATEKLEAIAARVLASTGSRVRFALTETINDPQLVSQAYQEARLAVEIRPWAESAVVGVGGLGAYRLIVGAASSRHVVEFSRRTLAAVLEYDRKRKGRLVDTLRTYLANEGEPLACSSSTRRACPHDSVPTDQAGRAHRT